MNESPDQLLAAPHPLTPIDPYFHPVEDQEVPPGPEQIALPHAQGFTNEALHDTGLEKLLSSFPKSLYIM